MNMKKLTFTLLVLTVLALIPLTVMAQNYGIGGEGLKAGALPGAGNYYLMENSFYTADKIADGNGDTSDFDIDVFANVHRFVHVTETKFLGADVGFHVLVPVLSIDVMGDSEAGVGDIVIEPVLLGWHKDKFDAVLALAAYLPTGEYDKDPGTDIGNDHFAFQLTQATTFYFDEAKKWHASYCFRYETNLENRTTDLTNGDDIDFDWGIGTSIGMYDVGLVGYSQWQITEDSGASAGEKDEVHGIGVEFSGFVPALGVAFKTRYQTEYAAENKPKGQKFTLNLIVPF